MRKFQIIFFILTVAVSFFAFAAIGKRDNSEAFQQKASVLETISSQASLSDALPEITSQTEMNSSGAPQENLNCNPAISAQAALIRSLKGPDKFFQLNGEKHWPIASITKLMTASIALENMDMYKTITITSGTGEVENASGDLAIGEIFSAKDLVKAMLTFSSNRAAEALAQDFGREKFIGLMNAKARELNMNETNFSDPSGLSAKNQSVLNDIFRLADYVNNRHPDLLKITRTPKDYISNLNSKKKRKIININQFAGKAGFIGGKTGFLEEAQGNLVSIFSVKNNPAVIIVFGSRDRFGDTAALLKCLNEK